MATSSSTTIATSVSSSRQATQPGHLTTRGGACRSPLAERLKIENTVTGRTRSLMPSSVLATATSAAENVPPALC